MRSAFFTVSALLSTTSATLTSSADDPTAPIQLRTPPAIHSPNLGISNKAQHVPVRRSTWAPPPQQHEHHSVRGILALGQDSVRRRHHDAGPEPAAAAAVKLSGQSYVADVTVGGQEIPLLIDTGSADLWVAPEGFVCLDENHAEAPREACNIPVYFEGNFSGGVVEDEYFSISCTLESPPPSPRTRCGLSLPSHQGTEIM